MTVSSVNSLPARFRDCVSPDTRFLRLPAPVTLESGERLDEVVVAYRTWGDPANRHDRAVLVCHALTASADADAWWPGIIGEGAAFDPARDFVICSNLLGSCYGTTGPASRRPGSGRPWRADFPRITVRDMVEVQRRLLDHLDVDRLALVTGPSLGGMQALEWAVTHSDRVRAIAPIGVGGRHSAWCIAGSEAQRAAIYADSRWRDGYYDEASTPDAGLAAARMMAVVSYRSWQGFQERFGRDVRDDGRYQVQSYLEHQGRKFVARFDANCYVRLTQAMNSHDVARDRGAYFDVLETIEQPALVVSVSSDGLYPPEEQAVLARHLPNAVHRMLEAAEGHDGFLIRTAPLGALLREFRAQVRAADQEKTAATAACE